MANRKLPSADEVALYGYHAMMKGKAVAIHGFLNRLMAHTSRMAPMNLAVKITKKLLEKK